MMSPNLSPATKMSIVWDPWQKKKESHHKENNIISEITKYFKRGQYIIIPETCDSKKIKDKSTIYIKAVERKVGNSTDIIGHLIGQEVPARASLSSPGPPGPRYDRPGLCRGHEALTHSCQGPMLLLDSAASFSLSWGTQSVALPPLRASNELNISYNRHVFSHNLESIKICKNYFKTWDFQWSLAWTFFRHRVFQKRRETGALLAHQNNLWKSLIYKTWGLLSKSHYFHSSVFLFFSTQQLYSQVLTSGLKVCNIWYQ